MKSITLLVLLLLTINVHADVTFTDSTFNDLDWTDLKVADSTPGQNGTYSAQQVTAGGNPGAYRGFTHNWTGPGAIYVGHIKSGAEYDPSVQGAIQSVSFSIDAAWFSTNSHNAVAFAPLIIQDGNYYWGTWDQLLFPPDPQGTWINLEINDVLESDFVRLVSTGPTTGTPDFSVSGGAMQFGIMTENGTASGDFLTVSAGIDNWILTVIQTEAIPTLSEWGLILLALLLLAAGTIAIIRRRRSVTQTE